MKGGMKLLCRTLFGYAVGIVSINSYKQPVCNSESGDTAFFIEFVKDYMKIDGTVAPRWICIGSGNMKCLEKLMMRPDPA